MQTTRGQILEILEQDGKATVQDLAYRLEVATGTIRHHLAVLERDALVVSQRVRKNVGRPHLLYQLSEQGRERFPKRYRWLSSCLIEATRSLYGQDAIEKIMQQIAQDLVAERLKQPLEGKNIQERADILVGLLLQEGFAANWETDAQGIRIQYHNCPYGSVAGQHPEICLLDAEIIQCVMGTVVKREECFLRGSPACTFTVHPAEGDHKYAQVEEFGVQAQGASIEARASIPETPSSV